jgi:hypothetical protein
LWDIKVIFTDEPMAGSNGRVDHSLAEQGMQPCRLVHLGTEQLPIDAVVEPGNGNDGRAAHVSR